MVADGGFAGGLFSDCFEHETNNKTKATMIKLKELLIPLELMLLNSFADEFIDLRYLLKIYCTDMSCQCHRLVN